jgi:RNA binding exosome subunit
MKEPHWQEDPLLQAAAFEGLAGNPVNTLRDRLEFALKANELLHQAIKELKDEIEGC